MKNLLYIIFIVLFHLNTFSQKNIFQVTNKNTDTELTNNKFNLIIISNSGCGHCLIALEKIKEIKDKVNIVIVDFGNAEDREKLKLKYKEYVFLNGENIKELGFQDLFPKLYLFDNKGNLLWKKKGWFKKNLIQINSKIKSQ